MEISPKVAAELGLRISRRTDGIDLELPAIEKLIRMHQGRCTIDHEWQMGTTISVLFPYRTKEECQHIKQHADSCHKTFANLCDWNSVS